MSRASDAVERDRMGYDRGMSHILTIFGPFRLLLMMLMFLMVSGCASDGIQVGVQNRSEQYRQMLDPQSILSSKTPRCAVLPTFASGSNAGIASFANVSFAHVARKQINDVNILFHADVVNRLNLTGEVDLLNQLLASIDPGDFLERDKLQRVGTSLGVEYLLLPRLVTVITDNATRLSFAGFTFIRTGWTTVELGLQLWHAPTGQLVWQATGSGTLVVENVAGSSPSIQTTLDALLSAILFDFAEGRFESILSTDLPSPAVQKVPPPPASIAPVDPNPVNAVEPTAKPKSASPTPTTDQP